MVADQVVDRILRNLVVSGGLSAEQAQQLQQQIGDSPDKAYEILVEGKVVSEEAFTQARATALELPYVNLGEINIPREVLEIIPESTARGHMIIAYEDTAASLKVGMVDPSDRQIVEFVRKKVDKPIEISIASPNGVRTALGRYQRSIEMELQDVIDTAQGVAVGSDLTRAAEDLPVIRIVDTILKHAILQGASDIHMEPMETQVIIRYRIDGILHDILTLPKNVLAGLVARVKVLSNLKIDEHRLPQDGRFKVQTEDYNFSLRVSILPVFDGEKVVMRLLDESGQGIGLDELGMRTPTLEILRKNLAKPNGMILVTGPTGSGKTTTLYAAMKELNTEDVNISTVEDPIEYRMPRINQTQVQPAIGLTFANGLRSLVRQDPDIIMVGEIRDEETASLAVNAALTGHLVLSTLHTNSAVGALPRLLDMNVEGFLVASTVNLILAQRLVRKLCDRCRKEITVTNSMLESIEAEVQLEEMLEILKREKIIRENVSWKQVKLYEAVGCEKCRGGYKGRTGIYEAVEVTPEIQKMINRQTTSQDLQDAAKAQQHMVTMVEDGIIKAIAGITTLEEVLRVAKE